MITKDFLSRLPHLWRNSSLPSSNWYTVSGAILISFNECRAVGDLYQVMEQRYPQRDDIIVAIRRLREALLKCSALSGFPRGINGLAALNEAIPTEVKNALGATPHLRSWDPPPPSIYPRGKAYFTTLYSAAHTPKIIANMAATHPDLPVFAINHLYAGAISDTTILDAPSSVLVNFSATVATDSAPQAKGHIHGCRNFGVGRWEIQSAIKAVTTIAEEVKKAGGPRVAWETMGFIKRFGGKVPGEDGWEQWVWDVDKEDTVKAKL